MPSATRKMKASRGSDGSAPSNPRRRSKAKALAPSAAANDTITVTISTSGATTARSSSPRITSTTSRTRGMTTLRSRADALARSRLWALWPPTTASAPSTAWTLSRSRSMAARSSGLSGAPSRVAWSWTSSAVWPAGRTSATPSVPRAAASTWSAWPALAMTVVCWPVPDG